MTTINEFLRQHKEDVLRHKSQGKRVNKSGGHSSSYESKTHRQVIKLATYATAAVVSVSVSFADPVLAVTPVHLSACSDEQTDVHKSTYTPAKVSQASKVIYMTVDYKSVQSRLYEDNDPALFEPDYEGFVGDETIALGPQVFDFAPSSSSEEAIVRELIESSKTVAPWMRDKVESLVKAQKDIRFVAEDEWISRLSADI